MSVSDPWEKFEWGADREPWKNERVPSSVYLSKEFLNPSIPGKGKTWKAYCIFFKNHILKILWIVMHFFSTLKCTAYMMHLRQAPQHETTKTICLIAMCRSRNFLLLPRHKQFVLNVEISCEKDYHMSYTSTEQNIWCFVMSSIQNVTKIKY